MIAVFERIGVTVLEDLLKGSSGDDNLVSFLDFRNQLRGEGAIPDASISSSFHYLFEVKTERDAAGLRDQVGRHLALLDQSAADKRLFVITPDSTLPPSLAGFNNETVAWFSFRDLSSAIDSVLANEREPVAEQDRFLLRELQALFDQDGLLSTDDVVVVAARVAYAEYLRYAAYICQADRTFRRDIERFGFYASGEIKTELPMVLGSVDRVTFADEPMYAAPVDAQLIGRVSEIVRQTLADGVRKRGVDYKVVLLSSAEDERTLRLARPVRNVSVGRSGRTAAWVQGQRYTRSESLVGAETTADLEVAL